MPNPEPRAIQITSKNTSVLHNISNVDENAFKANLGWIFVEDWSKKPNRFLIMPVKVFNEHYPNLELSILKVDEIIEPMEFEVSWGSKKDIAVGLTREEALGDFQKQYGFWPESYQVEQVK